MPLQLCSHSQTAFFVFSAVLLLPVLLIHNPPPIHTHQMLLSNICYQFPQPISCIIIVVVIITPLPSSYDEKQNSEGKNKFHTPLCPVPKTHKTENRPPQKIKLEIHENIPPNCNLQLLLSKNLKLLLVLVPDRSVVSCRRGIEGDSKDRLGAYKEAENKGACCC